MKIDDREFEPDGWFGSRGIDRAIAEERAYIRFGPGDVETVFSADDKLRANAGFFEWLVKQSKTGGYVMQKHPVPDALEGVVAQVRPDRAPVTEVTYHDHTGMKHVRGTGCPCGAKRHRRAYTQRPYNEHERKAHEGGKAHTEPDPATGAVLPVDGPHRHTEEGKYMMNPNRDRQPRPHRHRTFLPPKFEPYPEVLAALVTDPRRPSRKIADELGVPESAVEDARPLAKHIRRPIDHRRGGHGDVLIYAPELGKRAPIPDSGSPPPGIDDEHDHMREVTYSLQPVEFDYPAHRTYRDHGKRFKAGPHWRGYDARCRKCSVERHIRAEHVPLGIPAGKDHQHIRTERVPLPSTEKRLDVHPRTRRRLEDGERPTRAFFSIEGTPKSDSLVARDEIAFDVPSVTMWRAPGLEDFAGDYLSESIVFIVPDSDWASNPAVAFQAFECRDYLRGILGELEVHVAAAHPKCGDVCNHVGQKRKDHKRGVDDLLGERNDDGSPRFAVDDLLVMDRYPSDLWHAWEGEYRARYRKDRAETDVGIMEWLALHATENVERNLKAGQVKRSITSIQEHLTKRGRRLTERAIEKAFDRLLADGVIETVPAGLDLKRITKYRHTGSRTLYLGEDWEGGVTFRIHHAVRWSETHVPIGQMMGDLVQHEAWLSRLWDAGVRLFGPPESSP